MSRAVASNFFWKIRRLKAEKNLSKFLENWLPENCNLAYFTLQR